MTADSFYWYDIETSGTHPASDRIVQFAGRRTNARLEPLDEPCVTYVRLAPDVLPNPESCLVTGVTPQQVNAKGVDEWQALRRMDAILRQPGTCVVGYNNLRFDDEFLRFGLYRNLMEPYAREWQNGNSRWDLIDLARAACALRPAGIQWPREDGVVTFRLERLTAANDIPHGDAHDALADVEATLALARLIRAAQPKLWRYALDHRSKQAAAALLAPLGSTLCVHVSGHYANERFCTAPVISVARHPQIDSRIIVADLSRDVSMLLDCDADELRERLFAPRDAASEDSAERPPLKEVVANRCPFVAPIDVVKKRPDVAKRLRFDWAAIEQRRRLLAAAPDLARKIGEVYRRPPAEQDAPDAELALYDGFIDDADRAKLPAFHAACQAALESGGRWPRIRFVDARLEDLAARLKARLRPDALSAAERDAWEIRVRRCLEEGFGKRPSLARYRDEIDGLLAGETDPERRRLLDALAAYRPPPWPA